jgi:hypothetical protein
VKSATNPIQKPEWCATNRFQLRAQNVMATFILDNSVPSVNLAIRLKAWRLITQKLRIR